MEDGDGNSIEVRQLQKPANHTSDHIGHAVKAQIVGMTAVHGAGIPLIAFEEALPIKEVDVGVAMLEGLSVGGEDHVPALGMLWGVQAKIRTANQENREGRLLPSDPLIERLVGTL